MTAVVSSVDGLTGAPVASAAVVHTGDAHKVPVVGEEWSRQGENDCYYAYSPHNITSSWGARSPPRGSGAPATPEPPMTLGMPPEPPMTLNIRL
jgi:hypothetical protein